MGTAPHTFPGKRRYPYVVVLGRDGLGAEHRGNVKVLLGLIVLWLCLNVGAALYLLLRHRPRPGREPRRRALPSLKAAELRAERLRP